MLTKGERDLVCSARGCQEKAQYAVVWSNPKIHTNRSKTWLSCPEHKEFLTKYIQYRKFPFEVKDIGQLDK